MAEISHIPSTMNTPAKIHKWYTKSPKEFRKDLWKIFVVIIPQTVFRFLKSREGQGLATVLIISALGLWIKSEPKIAWYETLFDNLESIALGSAGVIFLLETKERQKRDHYEAWQVINSAMGQSGSGGRIKALQDLNKDGISLEGLSALNADLSEIDLHGANLERAKLCGANLQGANLQGANLDNADLTGANLNGADLRNAHLGETNLQDASLMGANLQDTFLCNLILNGACLWGANLKGCSFTKQTKEELDLAYLCQTTLPEGYSRDPNRDCETLGFNPETGEYPGIDNYLD